MMADLINKDLAEMKSTVDGYTEAIIKRSEQEEDMF